MATLAEEISNSPNVSTSSKQILHILFRYQFSYGWKHIFRNESFFANPANLPTSLSVELVPFDSDIVISCELVKWEQVEEVVENLKRKHVCRADTKARQIQTSNEDWLFFRTLKRMKKGKRSWSMSQSILSSTNKLKHVSVDHVSFSTDLIRLEFCGHSVTRLLQSSDSLIVSTVDSDGTWLVQ